MKVLRLLVLSGLFLLLAACNHLTPYTSPAAWDQAVWDQSRWQ